MAQSDSQAGQGKGSLRSTQLPFNLTKNVKNLSNIRLKQFGAYLYVYDHTKQKRTSLMLINFAEHVYKKSKIVMAKLYKNELQKIS